jgi:hypothetical protein
MPSAPFPSVPGHSGSFSGRPSFPKPGVARARGLLDLRCFGLVSRPGHTADSSLGWLSLSEGPQLINYSRRIL